MHHKHLETGLRLVRLKIQCQRVAMNKLLETVARSLHDSLAGIPDWLTDFKENLVEQLPATNMEELRAPSHSSVEPALEHPVEVATKKSRKHSVFTHFPKDRNCDVCLRTTLAKASCRRRTGEALPRSEKFWWPGGWCPQGMPKTGGGGHAEEEGRMNVLPWHRPIGVVSTSSESHGGKAGLPARVSGHHEVRGRQSSPFLAQASRVSVAARCCARVTGKAGENGHYSAEWAAADHRLKTVGSRVW